MVNSFNPLDPMHSSTYLESTIPSSIDEALATYPECADPNGPKLKPQLTQDSWYYSNDNSDDGRISGFEKVKAFLKGGTYNMIHGMFCDKNGFSIPRTALTLLGATAITLTGPIGVAVASGIGAIAGITNFVQSSKLASKATTDAQARKAYEGYGESASTIGLSLFGGFKSLKALKNNFDFAKANPNGNFSLKDKLMKWKLSLKNEVPPQTPPEPQETKPPQQEVVPTNPTNSTEPPTYSQTSQTDASPYTTSTSTKPPTYVSAEPSPQTSNISQPIRYDTKPNVKISDTDARGYIADWEPTGYPEVSPQVEYFPNTTPTGEIPRNANPAAEYFSPYKPIDNSIISKPKVETTTIEQPKIVLDTESVDTRFINPEQPQPDFTYGMDNNHFFG